MPGEIVDWDPYHVSRTLWHFNCRNAGGWLDCGGPQLRRTQRGHNKERRLFSQIIIRLRVKVSEDFIHVIKLETVSREKE